MTDPVPHLQRNPHPYPVDIPAIPASVEPGESVLWPYPIAGFEPVPDDPPTAAPEPTTSKKRAAAPATTEGVTGDAAQ